MSAKAKLNVRTNSLPALLNHCLASTLDLKLQIKQAHWNVKGDNFIALHELFDRVATEIDAFADDLAERAVQLGTPANGLAQDIAKHSELGTFPSGFQDGSKYVKAATAAIGRAADVNRKAIDVADDFGDKVTADLLTGVARGLDKLRWLVDSHQK